MTYATLSLDLKDAQHVRDDVYEMIEQKNWRKLEGVDTVWAAQYLHLSYIDSSDVRKMVNDISGMIIECAKTHKLDRINYIAQIGNRDVIVRQVVRTPTGYSDQAYVKPEKGR
ncbi:hypothetical protein [Pseudomonas sp. TE3610]